MAAETPDPGDRPRALDNPKNVRLLIRIFFALCVVMLGLDFAVHRHLSFADGVFTPESWFGFYAFYGLGACVLLVLAAKEMRKVLMRPEDYYDR